MGSLSADFQVGLANGILGERSEGGSEAISLVPFLELL